LTILLDTTILIDSLQTRRTRQVVLAELVRAGHILATSAINVAEIYAGMRAGEEADTAALLSGLVCYPITLEIAERAGRLKQDAARRGRTFALDDMLLAATAVEYDLTLWTDNKKDFAVPGVQLFQPA
jgi:predicted nucleic acid-binding protein